MIGKPPGVLGTSPVLRTRVGGMMWTPGVKVTGGGAGRAVGTGAAGAGTEGVSFEAGAGNGLGAAGAEDAGAVAGGGFGAGFVGFVVRGCAGARRLGGCGSRGPSGGV